MLRWLAWLAAAVAAIGAAPALACDVTTPTATALSSYSPAALKAAAVPYLRSSGGFGCDPNSIVALLSGNYLRATLASDAVLTLTSTTSSDVVSYKLAADAGGATQLTPGTPVVYMQNTLVNVAGLLGSDVADVPVYIKPSATATIVPGTYTGSFAVRWSWSFCKGVSVTNVCVLGNDTGSKIGTVNVTLTVAAKPATVSIASSTTWDPVQAGSRPKAIPGSKLRLAVTITNPDLVALDANSLAVALPTPPRLAIALDGDGTGTGAVVQTSQGATPSTLTLAYTAADNATDNVDFSNDNGTTWTFAPTAGDAVTQGQVTRIRLRPQGSMAAGSSFTVSVPYSVK